MANQNTFGRRTALKGIGGVLAGVLASGVGAAADEVSKFASELTVENGRVVVVGDGSAPVKRFEEIGPKQEIDAEFVAGFLNYGVKQGDFQVFEQDGQVMAEPAVDIDSGDGSVQPLCGIDHLTWDLNLTNGQVEIWMDHDTTEDIALMLLSGAALSEVAAALAAATGVGAVPAAALAIIGAALGYFTGVLTIVDDGCGVHITFTKYYDPITPPFASIEPQ